MTSIATTGAAFVAAIEEAEPKTVREYEAYTKMLNAICADVCRARNEASDRFGRRNRKPEGKP